MTLTFCTDSLCQLFSCFGNRILTRTSAIFLAGCRIGSEEGGRLGTARTGLARHRRHLATRHSFSSPFPLVVLGHLNSTALSNARRIQNLCRLGRSGPRMDGSFHTVDVVHCHASQVYLTRIPSPLSDRAQVLLNARLFQLGKMFPFLQFISDRSGRACGSC